MSTVAVATGEHKGRLENQLGALLPTPVVNDMGAGKTPEEWDAWTEKMQAQHDNGNGHGASLAIEAQRLLPTPRSQNGEDRNNNLWVRPLDEPQNLENALARLGETTPPPSTDGNAQSDGQLPLPLTSEDDSPPTSSSG